MWVTSFQQLDRCKYSMVRDKVKESWLIDTVAVIDEFCPTKMLKIPQKKSEESPEYLRGYRDGQIARQASNRTTSADGILGALLAIALLGGLGYLVYNYVTTGHNPIPRVHISINNK